MTPITSGLRIHNPKPDLESILESTFAAADRFCAEDGEKLKMLPTVPVDNSHELLLDACLACLELPLASFTCHPSGLRIRAMVNAAVHAATAANAATLHAILAKEMAARKAAEARKGVPDATS